MGRKTSTNKKCQTYLASHKRISNKTKKLEKYITDRKPEVKEKIKTSSRIGRKKEGFTMEDFKKLPPKLKKGS